MSKVLKNEEKFSRWESREGVELWMSLAGLQNGRRAWWRDARLLWRDGEGRLEGKLQRPHIAFPEMGVILPRGTRE